MKKLFEIKRFLVPFIILSLTIILFILNCTKETIIIYKPFTKSVTLKYPPDSDPILETMPSLIWELLDEAVNYQVQLASDPAFSSLVFTKAENDTMYLYQSDIDNGHYYWRVRAKNTDNIWGDWSDAKIRSFHIGENQEVVRLTYPLNSMMFAATPQLIWRTFEESINYSVQISGDVDFSVCIVDTVISDTTYRYENQLSNSLYFWRVSAQINDSSWSALSEATIWFFRISDGSEYDVDVVELVYPPNTGLTFVESPELIWNRLEDAEKYQIMIATNSSFTNIEVNDTTFGDTDTTYTCGNFSNDLYYWRVRAQNDINVWGDWSDAMVWSFRINNSSNYIGLLAVASTPGTAQDVFVNPEKPDSIVAYVADGHALLTMFDVTNPAEPVYLANIDRSDGDFAQSVWKVHDDHIAYVADMDGKIMALDIRYPYDPDSYKSRCLFWEQNLECLTGISYPYPDTLYLFSVHSGFSKRYICFNQIVYVDSVPQFGDAYNVLPIKLPSDPEGVCFDTMSIYVEYCDTTNDIYTVEYQSGMFVFVAVSQVGLWWLNVSATHTADGVDSLLLNSPQILGWGDTPSIALAVTTQGGFAYVADDRGGLQIFDLPDTIPSFDHDSLYSADPVLISNINTSGRTKDVHVVGNRCYLADGSGGLKVIDISNPYAPCFLAAYSTPYAYGVWADEDNSYITDRDNGLMIFENR